MGHSGEEHMIAASCHCGAVRMEITDPPQQVTDCNCLICRRLGILWAYYRPGQVRLIRSPGATTAYVRGDRTLEFHHCKLCGCTTHWESTDKTNANRMAVNARLFEAVDLDGIPVRKFDGASL
jgi:hypothetical protein